MGLFKMVTERFFSSKSVPKQVTTQAKHVREKVYGGSTKAMAAAYGVKDRTVQRWISGDRGKARLPKETAARLEAEAAAAQVTERGRKRARQAFVPEGAEESDRRADSGHAVAVSRAGTFAIKGSDAVRQRDVTVYLTNEEAASLAGSDSEDAAHEAVGDALARYFNAGGFGGFTGRDFTFDDGDVSFF